jgi:hypothetical protein
MEIIHINCSDGPANPVQWAMLDAPDQLFVVFRGSKEPMDWITNLQGQSRDDGLAHGHRVHNGMVTSLHKRELDYHFEVNSRFLF